MVRHDVSVRHWVSPICRSIQISVASNSADSVPLRARLAQENGRYASAGPPGRSLLSKLEWAVSISAPRFQKMLTERRSQSFTYYDRDVWLSGELRSLQRA